jgi:putative peptidoglycan lipid II flippase
MFLQWAIQWPEAARLGFRPRLAWPSHPAIREALALMAFALVSQSVIQLNFVVNQFFASFLPNGFVSYLYYGNRLMLLPFGVLGVAIATVSFPLLSRQAGPGQDAKFNRTITRSLGSALYFTLPATVGLILLASPVSRLAFQHGAFTAEDTRWVSRAVALYMLGLPGNTGTKILITVYYAKNRPRWSLWAALTSFLTNLAVNGSLFLAALSPGIRLDGIILAAGISSTVNLCILLGGLPRVGVKVNWNWLGREALGVLAATLLMGLATWGALRGLEFLRLPYGNLWMSLLPAALGAWVYFLVTRRWGLESSGTILRRGA